MNEYCFLTLSKFEDHLERLLTTTRVAQPKLRLRDIYVVDDGLSDSIKKRWKVNYIEGKKPFSFSKNLNVGLAAVPKGKDVFFIGDDGVVVTKNGINLLAKAAYSDSTLGMTGPVVVGGTNNPYQKFGVLYKPTRRSELEGKPNYQQCMIFIAVYIKREVIDKVGLIPETLSGYGYEDDYFTSKMIKAGYDWLLDPEVVVLHGWENYGSSASFRRSGHDVEKLLEHNRKIYEELKKNDL